jgi:hypothetical protein
VCFGYSNLGPPLNPRDAFFYQTKADFFGRAIDGTLAC